MQGRIKRPEDFGRIVVARRGGQLILLEQVANVVDSQHEQENLARYNGQRILALDVLKAQGQNTIDVVDALKKSMMELQATLDQLHPGMKLEMVKDGSRQIRVGVENVRRTLIEGALLTILIVFLFLNSWRSTVITGLTLPVSLIGTFLFMDWFGFTINMITLMALSLCVGLLIDDAIVVRENIVRHMEMGKDRRTAASEGTQEIGLAVAATTFSIVAVFIPVAFMPGVSGEWFRPFALTVATSVLVSLFISFTLDPMLSAYWGDPPGHHHAPKKGISKVLQSFNDWFDHQADRYGKVIAWALHHRRWMAVIAFGTLIAAFALQGKYGGTSFLPSTDAGSLMIQVRTPPSSSLEYARLKMERAAAIARELPETKETNSSITPAGGRIYVDIGKRHEQIGRAHV